MCKTAFAYVSQWAKSVNRYKKQFLLGTSIYVSVNCASRSYVRRRTKLFERNDSKHEANSSKHALKSPWAQQLFQLQPANSLSWHHAMCRAGTFVVVVSARALKSLQAMLLEQSDVLSCRLSVWNGDYVGFGGFVSIVEFVRQTSHVTLVKISLPSGLECCIADERLRAS